MDFQALTSRESILILATVSALAVMMAVGIAAVLLLRKRRSAKLRSQFGPTQYELMYGSGGRREAEAGLDGRMHRIGSTTASGTRRG